MSYSFIGVSTCCVFAVSMRLQTLTEHNCIKNNYKLSRVSSSLDSVFLLDFNALWLLSPFVLLILYVAIDKPCWDIWLTLIISWKCSTPITFSYKTATDENAAFVFCHLFMAPEFPLLFFKRFMLASRAFFGLLSCFTLSLFFFLQCGNGVMPKLL
jgi:hypothetical protein